MVAIETQKPHKIPPPEDKDWLIHEGCGGTFSLLKDPDRSPKIDDERVCSECRIKETYELDKLIIVAKPGISEEDFIEFLVGLTKTIMGVDKIRTDEIGGLVKILRDRSNPSVIAGVICYPDIGKDRNAEMLVELRSRSSEEYHRMVSAVYRYPKTEAEVKTPEKKRKGE